MKFFLAFVFTLLFSGIEAQTLFEFTKYDEKSQPAIETEMYKYHIEPDTEQMKSVLKVLMSQEIPLHYIYSFIRRFPKACDQAMFEELISKWESDMKMEEISPYEDWDEVYYKFICLDFNKDRLVDLILMPEGFFGPSLGLVCFASVDGKFKRLFDKAGYVVKFEKRGDEIILQYETTIIEEAESNVLETLVYDLKSNQLSQHSKLYYANDTRLPQKIGNRGQFVLIKKAALRSDKKNFNKKFPEDWFHVSGRGSKKLRGNVVADYPPGVKGYILAEEKGFVFVAFNPDAEFLDCSLRHGMDSEEFENYKPIPKPFICGWVKNSDLKRIK